MRQSPEAAYLAHVLVDPEILVRYPLDRDDFEHEQHRRAFQVATKLAEQGRLSHATLAAAIQDAMYVASLDVGASMPEAAWREILDRKRRRQIQRALHSALSELRQEHTNLNEVVAEALHALIQVREDEGPQPLSRVMAEGFDAMLSRVAGHRPPVTSGWNMLDDKIVGWEPGRLYLVAARPKSGKTSFVLQSATAAAKQGVRVYLSSQEMAGDQLVARLIAQEAQVNSVDLRLGRVVDYKHDDVFAAVKRLKNLPIVVDTRARLRFDQLRGSIYREHALDPLGLVAIDYVQLLRWPGRTDGKWEELENIAYGLKSLAKQLDLPVVAISQLNRDQDENEPPTIRTLKGSGGLEQAADMVILLWRPPKADRTVELIVAANRDGPTGKMRLAFAPEFARFE